jgi:hypothetical protein
MEGISSTEVKQQPSFQTATESVLNKRRKSNGDTTTRPRHNGGMIGSLSSLNLARNSLPKLRDLQSEEDQQTNHNIGSFYSNNAAQQTR